MLPEIRGVINSRGKVIPLIDLRVKRGLPSANVELDELIQLLHDREQDQHNWLPELEACVRERRQFKLARDPHACKFGLWHDKFQTDNSLLKMALKKMDAPHQRIHAAADGVLQWVERGDVKGAQELLAAKRSGELKGVLRDVHIFTRYHQQHDFCFTSSPPICGCGKLIWQPARTRAILRLCGKKVFD